MIGLNDLLKFYNIGTFATNATTTIWMKNDGRSKYIRYNLIWKKYKQISSWVYTFINFLKSKFIMPKDKEDIDSLIKYLRFGDKVNSPKFRYVLPLRVIAKIIKRS